METIASFSNGSGEATAASAPTPFAILDFLVPGFSTISSFVKTYLGIDLNVYIPILLVVGGAIYAWNYVADHFWNSVTTYLMSSVTIRTDDEIFDMVMAWIAQQGFSRKSRRFMANTKMKTRRRRYYDSDDDDEDDEDKRPLKYTPSFGSHFFWYRGRLIKFVRDENKDRGAVSYYNDSDKQELTLQCFGRSPAILKELLIEARVEYARKDENKTLIYRGGTNQWSETSWQRCLSRSGRPFSTVILNENLKTKLLDDVTDYLNPLTRRWYANRGIPYRRGYLFWGPPGTGKSSASLALAGYFNMEIYMVSLNSPVATEENLTSLFADLPRRCVVLLEDIDSAGLSRTIAEDTAAAANKTPQDPNAPPPPPPKEAAPNSRLSLSGLLNILDGVASQEGRVLVMTTNHLEKLDKALIRPGRIDMITNFGLADSGMAAALFRSIYTPYPGEQVPGSKTVTGVKPTDEQKKEVEQFNARIEMLSHKFGATVPELEFSPAEIQGLLLKNKMSPEEAIENVDAWVVETRADKKAKEVEEAEQRRKEAEEEKEKLEKEEKEKKEEEDKEKRRERRRARKAKRRDAASSSSSESESGSGSSSSDGDEADSEAEEKKEKTKKSKKTKKAKKDSEASPAKETKVDEDVPEPMVVPSLKVEDVSGDETSRKHMKRDSGYGTPTESAEKV